MPTDISHLAPYRSAVSDNRRWREVTSRPGDIVVCAPSKCGTTWTQTIVARLLWPDGDAPAPVQTLSPWIEFDLVPREVLRATLEAQTSRRSMKSHTPADGIPLFADTKYLVVGRDGRDAFMSMCNHAARFKRELRAELDARAVADGLAPMPAWTGDVHAFFSQWLSAGQMFGHIASFWALRDDPRLHWLHFNDLKEDLAGEMRRVADFLHIDIPESRWPAVVDACTFASMRGRSAEIGAFERAFEGGAEGFLYRGTNGRWRDVLTHDELESYARRVAELLPPDAAAWLEHGRRARPAS